VRRPPCVGDGEYTEEEQRWCNATINNLVATLDVAGSQSRGIPESAVARRLVLRRAAAAAAAAPALAGPGPAGFAATWRAWQSSTSKALSKLSASQPPPRAVRSACGDERRLVSQRSAASAASKWGATPKMKVRPCSIFFLRFQK
jgi:hypothetical protein